MQQVVLNYHASGKMLEMLFITRKAFRSKQKKEEAKKLKQKEKN